MNLNKDPSSYARINPVVVATWAPSEVQQFVGLALDDIGKLAAELDRRIQWQSFATAPKEGDFLVWHRGRIRQVCLYNGPDFIPTNTVIDSQVGRIWVATHWMPVPKPPAAVGEEAP